jgi:hypothetical protein
MSKLGIKCKAYYNSASYGSPTWVEVDSIVDLTATVAWETAAAAARANRVNVMMKTALNLSFSGMLRNDASTDAAKILELLLTDASLDMLILDGPNNTNGVEGFRCDIQVMEGSEDQGRGTVLMRSISLMPTPSANAIRHVKIATGVPTYGTINGDTISYA